MYNALAQKGLGEVGRTFSILVIERANWRKAFFFLHLTSTFQ
jgi:hypothetical protein